MDRWREIEALFDEAGAQRASDRDAYLRRTCGEDLELYAEVTSLLSHDDDATDDGSWAARAAARLLVETLGSEQSYSASLAPGKTLGPYTIIGVVGAGGMGEVYRALDKNLNRDVAIKVLPESLARDPDRLARLKREAQVLASLNHQNIAAIYGFEDSEGAQALVLELVDGPTLADRIAQGPIPLDTALPIAKQIADALEAAHEQGIIHRDLKPANIKVRADGMVKVLDFGLAKAVSKDGATADPSQSPTISLAATRAGVILGTAVYMSPEQAKGGSADRRSDVWAFGCVLYEMLTGRRAFQGEDVSDVLVSVLGKEPDWRAMPQNTPAAVRRLLQRCLEKDRRERLPHIGVARLDIQEALTAPLSEAVTPAVPRIRAWQRPVSLVSAIVAVSIVTGFAVRSLTRPTPPRVTRLSIAPSSAAAAVSVNGWERDVAITPDGASVVFVGNNGTQLFVRELDRLEATPLSGLGAPSHPFLSPDGQWIGFFDDSNALKRVAITGGPALTVCVCAPGRARGGTWGADGSIIFADEGPYAGLLRVSATGGEPTALTKPIRERGEADHQWPEFVPGAQAVLFTITPTTGSLDNAQVAVLDLKTGTHKILVRGGSHAHYVSSGHLVYGVAGTLWAVAFHLARLEVVGTPTPILPQVVTTAIGAANFDVAQDGTLVYLSGGVQSSARTLVWVDRRGREEAINVSSRVYQYPRLAPDGGRVALDVRDQERDIWTLDLARETLTRFTVDPGLDEFPVWTPDGGRLVFSSERTTGVRTLFWRAADRSDEAERLNERDVIQEPHSLSPDGTRLVFNEQSPKTGWDLMVMTLSIRRPAPAPSPGIGEPGSAKHEVRPLLQSAFDEVNGEISPDGRWLAYQSNESGQREIYVRPFPDVTGGQFPISTSGGSRPLWARSGEELFYVAPNGALMSVQIERASTFTPGAVTKLFQGRYFVGGDGSKGRTYDVSPDGQRFLMIKLGGSGSDETVAPPSLIVVQNWSEELKQRVPTR